ncbi:MAG: RNA methyltransferase [Lentisphaeria bacterium]|nr:RNA methyltransferase [Lentisphaerota bacterium]MBO5694454.1 RNA methyltransferase [Lentisphaeria bacterium]MBO5802767.1 RNA methyltransferase [Lentisphaeria bacterium]
MELTSLQNPKVKRAFALRDRRERDREGVTILEGYRELTRAHAAGIPIRETFFCREMFVGENNDALLDTLRDAGSAIYECSANVLRKIAYRERPEGLIAIAEMKRKGLDEIPAKPDGLYLVAETIEKPGNLGSILRSADAVGATAVIVCNKQTDIFNPNVIRASTGAIFSMPLAETTSEEALAWLRNLGIKTLAATPHTHLYHTDVDMKQGVAIVVGAEQYGLSDYWMNSADLQVLIPMLGKMDSLNVATAATILLYEAARQRDWKPSN